MRVLHVMPSFWPATRYGGPIESVLRLCQALLREGIALEVVTTNADGEGDLPVPTDRLTDAQGVPVRYFARRPRTRFAFSAPLAAHLARTIRDFDLVHVTALFSFSSAAAMSFARAANVPYIVSPRGTLRPWALGSKRWKKAPYFHVIERPNLARAAGIHATSDEERDEAQRLLPGAFAFTVPNGIDLPAAPPVPRDPRRLVFLGRIHPVKGFDVLVPALSRLARTLPEVETLVAGPDEDGEWMRVEAAIARANPRPRVRWLGPVRGEDKLALLASAAALVLPSHSENFGMVVAEALACGTPVVVSKNCPWRAVEERGAGAWVDNTPEHIEGALRAILEAPEEARRKMGEAGRGIAEELGWARVARAMIGRYEEAMARGRRR